MSDEAIKVNVKVGTGMIAFILFLWMGAWLWTERAAFIPVGDGRSVDVELPEVSFVKLSAFPSNKLMPVGTAFANVTSDSLSWILGESDQGLRFVEVTGYFNETVAKKVRDDLLDKDEDYVAFCESLPSVKAYLEDDSQFEDEVLKIDRVRRFCKSALSAYDSAKRADYQAAYARAAEEFLAALKSFRSARISYRAQFPLVVPDVSVSYGKVKREALTEFEEGYSEVVVHGGKACPFGAKGLARDLKDYVMK